jgi:hypothetical protein
LTRPLSGCRWVQSHLGLFRFGNAVRSSAKLGGRAMKINCVLLGTFVIGVSFYACDLHAKEARATYFATAHCPMTGVTGTGRAANSGPPL